MSDSDQSDIDEFEKLLDASFDKLKRSFTPGAKVRGKIISITSSSVLVDIGAKSEGIVERPDVEDANGELTVKVGDEIETFFTGMEDGEFRLAVRLRSGGVDDTDIQNAAAAGIPLEGKVTGVTNGGLSVQVGAIRGFCPISQIDVRHVEDAAVYVGMNLTFKVVEYEGGNLVLSRRKYLAAEQEGQRAELQERLKEGDVITGVVQRVVDFGVFVGLGAIDGLVPMGELSYDHVADANTVVKVGESIEVKVIKLDWQKERVTLSLKQAGPDPWADLNEKFVRGTPYHGTIVKLMDFGAFVRLAPGVEGLIHISKLGAGKRLKHPSDVVKQGQEIDVFVDDIDLERHRISLSLENVQTGRTVDVGGGASITVGETIEGTVEECRPYGVFVKLNPRQTGLLHISEVEAAEGPGVGALSRKYATGSKLSVVVKAFHGGKISLGLPGVDTDGNSFQEILKEERGKGNSFGSMGDLFGKLKL